MSYLHNTHNDISPNTDSVNVFVSELYSQFVSGKITVCLKTLYIKCYFKNDTDTRTYKNIKIIKLNAWYSINKYTEIINLTN